MARYQKKNVQQAELIEEKNSKSNGKEKRKNIEQQILKSSKEIQSSRI
jgi:hypothetical protein